MTAKVCAVCGGGFTPRRGHEASQVMCSAACRVARSREHERAKRQPVRRNCLRCGTLMEARDRYSGNKRYCSDACRLNIVAAPVVTSADAAPCDHCGTLFEVKKVGRRQRFCQPACRVAHFKARHVEDDGSEIPVVDIDEAPRRLAVAKLFDRFEGGGAFDHGAPGPAWINPADRRHWR